ncbi:LysR family transcriptional regulator [Psychromonas sp. Urea-02u-13]|uniref:LysR family transcriptional regulator n=1 Tax=Psychromonas sp. Urea-02u-13 TaxID=2058326 RepID=UPI000C32BD13|nr:LysR family transcriptional regulator [Psychromonas sp. Urea-02u-13]PKG37475.1 LysR family transcriptional regulator [Psychromonas sp. Urea-02u-13]
MNADLNITDIRAFVLIAKAGSFTAAAELLSCSRSHLSKQLTQLESSLGVKLIIRTTRTQRLTEQGKVFFEQCSRSLEGIDQAIEQVIDSASAVKGVININCVGGIIGEEIITPLINDFINAYPEVRINLDFSSRRVDLIAGEFDIVFRMGALEDSNLIAKKLIDMPICTLASPQYLQQKGQLTHPSDLKHHQCITGTVNHWRYFNILTPDKKIEVSVDGAFKCKNGRSMIFSALAGNGIVRLPLLYCFKEIDEQKLLPVFKDWDSPISPFYLVYLQDKYQPARLKTFIQFVNSHITRYTQTS